MISSIKNEWLEKIYWLIMTLLKYFNLSLERKNQNGQYEVI